MYKALSTMFDKNSCNNVNDDNVIENESFETENEASGVQRNILIHMYKFE